MHIYKRYLRAELLAWHSGNVEKALLLARWKSRAYAMYGIDEPYF